MSKDCGKIGVLVSLEGIKNEDFGKKLAMHIAATAPLAVSETDMDKTLIDREKKIISEQLSAEGNLQKLQKKYFQEN